MKSLRIALLCLSSFSTLSAHDIITTNLTFTRDISRIFQRRCVSCHSAQASIPLTTYEEARPWAVSIKEEVLSRRMPPWGAVKGFGNLSPDMGLTQEEIMIIAGWVVGGAPKGNPTLLPATAPTAQTPSQQSAMKDALVVSNECRIDKPLVIVGIRPIVTGTVESARIVASFPDGHVEPLLWLFHYKPELQKAFHFRDPITLPPGSVVEAGSPLRFALEMKQ